MNACAAFIMDTVPLRQCRSVSTSIEHPIRPKSNTRWYSLFRLYETRSDLDRASALTIGPRSDSHAQGTLICSAHARFSCSTGDTGDHPVGA
jgi:hypothetical protein